MLDRAQLSALSPHSGSMCLLDSVQEWTSDWVRCSSSSHRDPANPLRGADGLAALHLTEYGAQAMAVHGALLAQGGPQAGMIGALRDIKLHVSRIDDLDAPLIVTAQRRLARSDGLIYDFVVAAHYLPKEGNPEHYDVATGLRTPGKGTELAVWRVRVGIEEQIDSLVPLFAGADWQDREQYDLVGVVFRGHPDLRRIMMPEDWEGHPLRKDYAIETACPPWR